MPQSDLEILDHLVPPEHPEHLDLQLHLGILDLLELLEHLAHQLKLLQNLHLFLGNLVLLELLVHQYFLDHLRYLEILVPLEPLELQ